MEFKTMLILRYKKLCKEAVTPQYQTNGAAGMDIASAERNPVTLVPGGRATIRTGLAFEIPEGLEIQVRPRGGHAHKYGITVTNSPGTVDEDYRGEVMVMVMLVNHGNISFVVNPGDRIAQAVLCPVIKAVLSEVEELSETERGEGRFGSTGVASK